MNSKRRDATQRKGESRITVSGHSGVRNDNYITVEFGPVALEKWPQIVAANFLLAFDKENQIHRQRSTLGKKVAGSQDVRHDLALVVGRAACIDAAVANGRLEGWGGPFRQRLRRLHIVVAVNKNRWLCRVVWRPGDHRRMTAGLIDLRLKTEIQKLVF